MPFWSPLVFLWILSSCTQSPPPPAASPQMILFGGVIYTQAQEQVVSAIALENGRVLAVGADEEILALAGPNTERLNLEGKAVYPGFADAHAHLVGIGLAAVQLDLVGTQSFAEVLRRVRERDRIMPPGVWIVARGWDQNDWEVQDFPNHLALSAAIPHRPVVLERVDGHALLANEAAMTAAGVERSTHSPDGGRVLRFASGELTGVFVDAAEDLIRSVIPEPSQETLKSSILAASEALHRQGITQFHDAGSNFQTLAVLEKLATDGHLQLRLHEMLDGSEDTLLEHYFSTGPVLDFSSDGTLAVRAVKLYADGALGSRGAALLEPYTDEPLQRGLILTEEGRMRDVGSRALEAGFQVCTHAIGDRGVRQSLDAYAWVFAHHSTLKQDARFRIEHAQVIHPNDLPRFHALGVIPSMQAQHQTSDMPWAEARLGSERIHGAYAWRSLLQSGCVIPGGSDAPVERLHVVAQFAAACTRKTLTGEPPAGWYPEESMTRVEALNMLTIWPAYAAFREQDLGRLAPGYRADLVVFDGDLMKVPEDYLRDCHPVMTVFAGAVVWHQEKKAH